MGQDPKRHCWECRRRCLVCDSTKPACNRCTAAGNLCPGYGDAKPTRLVWLAPGTVKSRVRRRKGNLPPGPTEPRAHDQSLVPVTQLGQRATAVLHPDANDISIPRFGMHTDADAVVYAAEYCNALRQLTTASTPIFPLFRNLGTTPVYIRYHPRLFGRPAPVLTTCGSRCCAQQAASLNWRSHVEGALKLVELRGGFASVAASKSLGPHLRFLYYVAVIGNTTCPASDFSMAREHLAALDAILELSDTVLMPFQMCPPPLFAAIIKINYLRLQAATHAASVGTVMEELAQEAYTILEQIRTFSPDQWTRTKPRSTQDWTLIGTIYQTSVALYCVSSLQSLSVLPTSPPLQAVCAAHATLLQQLLMQAVTSPRLKSFTLWPLVVLGVEAAHGRGGRGAMRDFVAARLPVLSREVGTCVPLTAKGVLERFWASGETGWDKCFRRGYAFVTQLAVDSSRILAG
ncbi:fungal-specific transcription factor domain-containing protein [Parachaetomium inaequale]|uniref:Fungal-specific transcription factor domain-containing protein n=1 Tax=Parachaetomium inaequale TaxID=2588326 RepID=A0AAN6PCM9_9PEZI|nr:fungal-specific transcription factor domain-containing protein [Parachaetomium inaequale]